MRALSLWQPWATAIALNSKRIETRGRHTYCRGPLAIHASARKRKSEMEAFAHDDLWRGALCLKEPGSVYMALRALDQLPFGAIIATCELVECFPTEHFTHAHSELFTLRGEAPYQWCEHDMGNYSNAEGQRYGWMLDNIKPLRAPIPYKGLQGFFNVPDHLFDAAWQPCPDCKNLITCSEQHERCEHPRSRMDK